MKNKKAKILALALSMSFMVGSQTALANEEKIDTENAQSLANTVTQKENDIKDQEKIDIKIDKTDSKSDQNVEDKDVDTQEDLENDNSKENLNTKKEQLDKKSNEITEAETNTEKESKKEDDAKGDDNQLEVASEKKHENLKQSSENSDNEMIAEFLVEIDRKDYGSGGLVGTEDKLLDNNVNANVYGGAPTGEIKDAIEKIEFEVYDENGKLLRTVKPTLDEASRWTGGLYIKGLEKDKKYKIKVKSETIPDGYTYWFSNRTSGKNPEFEINTDEKDKNNTTVIVDPSIAGDIKYGSGRLNIGVFDIIFAKDDETAKNIYTYKKWVSKKNGKTYINITGWNDDYKEGTDYAKTRISKDHEIVKPEGFHKEGYRPLYWYTDFTDRNGNYHELKLDDYNLVGGNPFRRLSNLDGGNYGDVIKKGKSFIFKLNSDLPKVIFNTNDGDDAKDIEQDIYYLKTLNDNKLSNGDEIKNKVGTPTREGYTFKGWNTKADGSGDAFTGDTKVTDDMKVYAIWEKNKPQPNPNPNPDQNPNPDPTPDPIPNPTTDEDVKEDLNLGIDEPSIDDENEPVDDDKKDDKKDSEDNTEVIDSNEKDDKKIDDDKEKDDKSDSKDIQNQANPHRMKKSKDVKAVKANPKTGVATSTGIIASLVAASAGLIATKKKRNK